MARIGVDATSWLNPRGFGRFTRNVMTSLIARDPDTTYVLFTDERTPELGVLPPGARVQPVSLRQTPARAAGADQRRGVYDILNLMRAASRSDLDLFLFTSVYTYFPVLRVPTVVGVHDTIADDRPDLAFAGPAGRAAWVAKERLAVRTARTVFTVSEASRAKVAERFGLRPDAVPVVPEAPDAVFGPRSEADVVAHLGQLGLAPDGFLVYAGGISPHKNIETLLDAYARLRDGDRSAPPLVLVGDLAGDPYLSATATVRQRIAALGLQDHVLLPGFVSDESLACLFAGAMAAVLPSLAEGFGLPAVEAAACGAAVVLSDLPAHRESLGDAGIYFPATDAGALAARVRALLDDPALRHDAGRRAHAAVEPLSWDVAADRLGQVLHAAVGS